MKKELEEKLAKDFPSLFRDLRGPANQTCMHWGLECGDGWYNIIYNICKKIIEIDPKKEFYFEQIKEKYGMLRVYAFCSDEAEDIIEEGQRESAKTCEYCGSKEKVTREGSWIETLCKECRYPDRNVM